MGFYKVLRKVGCWTLGERGNSAGHSFLGLGLIRVGVTAAFSAQIGQEWAGLEIPSR